MMAKCPLISVYPTRRGHSHKLIPEPHFSGRGRITRAFLPPSRSRTRADQAKHYVLVFHSTQDQPQSQGELERLPHLRALEQVYG